MLTVLERQKYLKDLGLYEGILDGIEDTNTKRAYKALQQKYFIRDKDIDGLYGTDTDRLLIDAWRVATYTTNFRLDEFRCKCGGKYCTGYPQVLDSQLLANLQTIRTKYGSTTVTSGLRCSNYNKSVGGSTNSRHKQGKAVDIKGKYTNTESKRKEVMATWKTLPNQRYTYCNIDGNYPNMGSAIHIDVE